jgi:hypothetical protein
VKLRAAEQIVKLGTKFFELGGLEPQEARPEAIQDG